MSRFGLIPTFQPGATEVERSPASESAPSHCPHTGRLNVGRATGPALGRTLSLREGGAPVSEIAVRHADSRTPPPATTGPTATSTRYGNNRLARADCHRHVDRFGRLRAAAGRCGPLCRTTSPGGRKWRSRTARSAGCLRATALWAPHRSRRPFPDCPSHLSVCLADQFLIPANTEMTSLDSVAGLTKASRRAIFPRQLVGRQRISPPAAIWADQVR